MYSIYHISGIKIGCSSEPEKRVSDQGYSDYEILETHEDIYVASDRERELQKQYGYKVDTVPYYVSIEARAAGGSIGGLTGGLTTGKIHTESGHLKRIAHLGGKKNVESGHLKNISSAGGKTGAGGKIGGTKLANTFYTCPFCQIEMKGILSIGRHKKWCSKNPNKAKTKRES